MRIPPSHRAGQPAVSVILAVRNGERYLAEALNSVVAQDHPASEIIVVDGQSTDGTADIVRSYPGVRYVWQEGKGVADAYNTGIAAAGEDLIAFISHDDMWLPQKLGRQAAFMADHPHLQFTLTLVRHFMQEDQTPPSWFRSELLSTTPAGYCMETMMARRTVFDRVGQFDTSYTIAEDTDWFSRALDQGIEMAVLPEALLLKRVHNESTVASNIREQHSLLLRAMRSSIARKRSLDP